MYRRRELPQDERTRQAIITEAVKQYPKNRSAGIWNAIRQFVRNRDEQRQWYSRVKDEVIRRSAEETDARETMQIIREIERMNELEAHEFAMDPQAHDRASFEEAA